ESTRQADEKEAFQHGLVAKIRALGATRRRKTGIVPKMIPSTKTQEKQAAPKQGLYRGAPIVLRKNLQPILPQALAIGSSTGGPQALFSVFEKLKGKLSLPIFITQHMPATFTAILAEHLTKIYGLPCAEAIDGEKVVGRRVYVAPGDWHMRVVKEKSDVVIRLSQDAPVNYCRPAVDPMLKSIHEVYGGRALTVILTGMGHDGQKGCEILAETGGYIIGQDEPSSVVWGMPGAVATAGLCNAVLPLDDIPAAIENVISGRPS
ncbi:MAG: hypothetical protein JKY12_09865, partial [Sneathiella sp.]|nr:hypothetical protein [Sneathiella sp.]